MSRPKTERVARVVAAALTLGGMLAGCSDVYFDRRDAISLNAGDALAANRAAQTVDPWPMHSGNTAIGFNGQKMQSAVERYRTNRITPPANIYNSALESLQESHAPAASGNSGSSSGSASAGGPQQ